MRNRLCPRHNTSNLFHISAGCSCCCCCCSCGCICRCCCCGCLCGCGCGLPSRWLRLPSVLVARPSSFLIYPQPHPHPATLILADTSRSRSVEYIFPCPVESPTDTGHPPCVRALVACHAKPTGLFRMGCAEGCADGSRYPLGRGKAARPGIRRGCERCVVGVWSVWD